MGRICDPVPRQTGQGAAHQEEHDNGFHDVCFGCGLHGDAEEDGGLDREVDDAEGFFFLWGEEGYEECCDPLRIQAYAHADAVDIRCPRNGITRTVCRHGFDELMKMGTCSFSWEELNKHFRTGDKEEV